MDSKVWEEPRESAVSQKLWEWCFPRMWEKLTTSNNAEKSSKIINKNWPLEKQPESHWWPWQELYE